MVKIFRSLTPLWLERLLGMGGLWIVYFSFVLCISGIVAIAAWSAMLDFNESRNRLLHSEVNRLRTHAIRTAQRLQENLNETKEPNNLASLDPTIWLRQLWDQSVPTDDSHLYAAVIDKNGRIVFHSTPALDGTQLPANWYGRTVPEAGDDVVETRAIALTGGEPALDIRIPLMRDDQEVGSYHSGFNSAWFEQELSKHMVSTRHRWMITTLLICGIVVMACASSVSVTKRIELLRSTIALGHVRQLAELGQIAGGIAHEIRNPMNAIRLNLHVIEKLGQTHLVADDASARMIMQQTIEEMERIDILVRSLLEYARPEKSRAETLDLSEEIPAILAFLRPLLDHDAVTLDADLSPGPLLATIDRGRLRQVLLNLVTNSHEAAGPYGRIRVSLAPVDDKIQILVSDNGPGVPLALREKIFTPFFSTKELGTGLGLALVKRFVVEAGGAIRCQEAPGGGAEFRVLLPAVALADFQEAAAKHRAILEACTDSLAPAHQG